MHSFPETVAKLIDGFADVFKKLIIIIIGLVFLLFVAISGLVYMWCK